MTERNLISGFSEKDSKRVDLFLQKLFPHLVEGEYLVVGGLAIRYRLNQHGINYPTEDFNDLDLKALSIGALSPSVQEDFLIYHYHPLKNNSFFIALVDPETGIKVDIFDNTIKDERYSLVKFRDWDVKVVEVEDQLVKTIYDISRIAENDKVDPKQFLETELLSKIANLNLADEIWKGRNYSNYPNSVIEATKRAEDIRGEHPDWVKEHPFKRPEPYVCPNCENTSNFKLAPMEEVYKVLGGYVE